MPAWSPYEASTLFDCKRHDTGDFYEGRRLRFMPLFAIEVAGPLRASSRHVRMGLGRRNTRRTYVLGSCRLSCEWLAVVFLQLASPSGVCASGLIRCRSQGSLVGMATVRSDRLIPCVVVHKMFVLFGTPQKSWVQLPIHFSGRIAYRSISKAI